VFVHLHRTENHPEKICLVTTSAVHELCVKKPILPVKGYPIKQNKLVDLGAWHPLSRAYKWAKLSQLRP